MDEKTMGENGYYAGNCAGIALAKYVFNEVKRMATNTRDYGNELELEEMKEPSASVSPEQTPNAPEHTGGSFDVAPLPWIGALPNPHLGPMVVVDGSGYLVPLYTAGDLLRGFRMVWRISRE